MNITLISDKIKLCYTSDDLSAVEGSLTMSTKELSELTGVRHDNVKRTLEALVESEIVVQPQVEDEPTQDSLGRPRTEKVFHLCERSSMILAARLSPEFTAKVVDQWLEMRTLIREQFVLIEKQAKALAQETAEKLKIAREAEAVAERKYDAAKLLMQVYKPGYISKVVKDLELRELYKETLRSFLGDPKLSRYYAEQHNNVVKDLVFTQDKLKDLLHFTQCHCTVKPTSKLAGQKIPSCVEALSYKYNFL